MKKMPIIVKVKIIVAIIAGVIAICGITLQIFAESRENASSPPHNVIDVFDPDSFKPGVHGAILVDYDGLGKMDDELCIGNAFKGEDNAIIILENLNLDRYNISRFLLTPDENGNVELTVSVEECPGEKRQRVVQYLNEQNAQTYEYVKGLENPDADTLEYFTFLCSDEGKTLIDASVSHHLCKVELSNLGFMKSIGVTMTLIGTLVAAFSLLLIKFSSKAVALGTIFLLLAVIIIASILYRKRIGTFVSLKEYAPGIYSLNCQADYRLQNALDSNISTEAGFMSFVSEELFWGMPINISQTHFGCSSFAVEATDGHRLMGRNYDYPETDMLMIYTDPTDWYASISMADIGLLGLGADEGEVDPLSAGVRLLSPMLPYVSVDGINEAGVGISILQLDGEEIHQNKGKPDILMNVAIRAILDTCGSTDEAIAFLEAYDMHSMIDRSFHLFITDKTGKSVIIEWIDNEMIVTEGYAVTNHVLGKDDSSFAPDTDSMTRYTTLIKDISSSSGAIDGETAMSFLSDAALRSDDPDRMQTEWSCIYDLNDFKVTLCVDTKYDSSYTVTPEIFGVRHNNSN